MVICYYVNLAMSYLLAIHSLIHIQIVQNGKIDIQISVDNRLFNNNLNYHCLNGKFIMILIVRFNSCITLYCSNTGIIIILENKQKQ